MEAPETSLVESVRSTEPGYREMATAVSGLDLHRPDQPHTHGARGGQPSGRRTRPPQENRTKPKKRNKREARDLADAEFRTQAIRCSVTSARIHQRHTKRKDARRFPAQDGGGSARCLLPGGATSKLHLTYSTTASENPLGSGRVKSYSRDERAGPRRDGREGRRRRTGWSRTPSAADNPRVASAVRVPPEGLPGPPRAPRLLSQSWEQNSPQTLP